MARPGSLRIAMLLAWVVLTASCSSTATLDVAVSAAMAAGRHMVSRIGAQPIATKSDAADLVTEVDQECEAIIGSSIRAAFPSHALLGEESVEPGIDAAMAALAAQQLNSEWLWIIDPIDGTTNFVSGLPLCAVSIGVTRRGERMGAVVYDPFRDELFSAWRGEGATLNGNPIRASNVQKLSDAVLCACSPHASGAMGPAVRSIAAVMPRARSVRLLGSGVLNFAWVACGRLSAYWEPELAPWDSAAGTLLIEEAGGIVTDIDSSPYGLSTRAVLGSARGIHGELQQVLAEADAVRCDP